MAEKNGTLIFTPRQMEFRAWDLISNCMQDHAWLISRLASGIMRDFFMEPEESKLIIMQWTGLLDINKRKIFEGDIVKFAWGWDYQGGYGPEHRIFMPEPTDKRKKRQNSHIGYIEYDSKEYSHHHIMPYRWELGDLVNLNEVLGNIYQDAELLKQIEWSKQKKIK